MGVQGAPGGVMVDGGAGNVADTAVYEWKNAGSPLRSIHWNNHYNEKE